MVRKFADAAAGDRTSMLAALQAMDVDTSGITDAVPDPVLKAWLDSLQKASAPAALPADLAAVQKEKDRLDSRVQAFSDKARFSQARSGTLPISAARRTAMLSATPAGKAILAKARRK